jgi:hypothetical protein
MKTSAAVLLLALFATVAQAGPRSSTNYSIVTDIADGGGSHVASAAYTNDGSAGAITGISAVASPQEVARNGYIGQLSEITGLTLNSASVTSSVNETATLQLAAFQQLDDASFIAVNANHVTWSVVSGPITGISASGLATAGMVYQDTPTTVQGVYGGLTGTLNLTVLDSIADNFGLYAGDQIPDDWQAQYFGQNSPLAAPGADASGTGQTNLFKYLAGLNPLDPNSRFTVTLTPVPGQPGQMNVRFSPVMAGRTYTVTARGSLTGSTWSPINASAPSNNGQERTITDLSASGAKFYRVEITKP